MNQEIIKDIEYFLQANKFSEIKLIVHEGKIVRIEYLSKKKVDDL